MNIHSIHESYESDLNHSHKDNEHGYIYFNWIELETSHLALNTLTKSPYFEFDKQRDFFLTIRYTLTHSLTPPLP